MQTMRTNFSRSHFATLPRRVVFYSAAILFITLWWAVAFSPEIGKTVNKNSPFYAKRIDNPSLSIGPSSLSTLNRNEILEALSGKTELMCRLMLDWDLDAQILQETGYHQIRRLTSKELFFIKTYLREAKSSPRAGNDAKAYLPYTYDSAGILLALLSTEQIAALPTGFRNQKHLFPARLTDAIPHDVDPFHIDHLQPSKIEHAFIAPHSHPITLKAMEDRGIDLINLGTILNLEDLCRNILQIGDATSQTLKSRLLASFVKSAFFSLDNRLKLVTPPRTLYLNYFTLFSIPTSEYFYGKLVERTGMNKEIRGLKKQGWRMVLEMEDILNYDPECIVISTLYPDKLERYLSRLQAFSDLKAVKNNRLFFVDQKNVESPSQYIVLAYFDLVQALQESIQ